MLKRTIYLILPAILLLTGLACTVPVTVTIGQLTQSPTLPEGATATQEPSPALPTETVAASATKTTAPGAPTLAAVLVDPLDKKGVNLLAPDGGFLTELVLGSDLNLQSDTTVPSSKYTLPNESNRVIFYNYQGYAISEYRNPGDIHLLTNTQNLVALVGDAGCDGFSYATTEFASGGTQNTLYLTSGAGVGSAPPVLAELNPRGYAIFPVSIICGQGSPAGVWYAHMPYGIGGDIVFPPYSGLFRLDAGQPTGTLVLDEFQRFSGISDDHSLAAYSHRDDLTKLMILDVKQNTQVEIPALPTSDRGAGYAVFSPDNAQVAWMEGSGTQMSDTPDFHSVIRLAPTSADVQLEKQKTDAEFGSAVSLPKLWVKPVAWLDNTNLLVEGRGDNWEDAFILKLNTESGAITLFAKGVYLGKYYSTD
jgi:hypothetical protein